MASAVPFPGRPLLLVLAALGVWCLRHSQAADAGGEWVETAKFTVPFSLGCSTSVNGDALVVGALYDDDNGFSAGAAYVFEREGGEWVQAVKLRASDGAENDFFGHSASLSDDTIVIGAYGDDDNGFQSGSAYVFERDGGESWVQVAKLTPSDGAEGDLFGYSVAISGDRIVIGAWADDDVPILSGSAYVFERDGGGMWVETAKLTASDAEPADSFGTDVAISGSTLVAGAAGDDDNGFSSGSAYVFEQDADGHWIETAKLTASDGAGDDFFGSAVAISERAVIVGAQGDDDDGQDSGSVYVFERDRTGTWVEVAKLTASDAEDRDEFGTAVAVSADTLVVGAEHDDDHGPDSGSAYVYERAGNRKWVETAKLTASDGAPQEAFGRGVAIHLDTLVAGDFGSAYIFERPLFADGFESGDTSVWSETLP